jgi:NTE family protein
VINATNLQSGALWRFMSPYMRDWRVGENRRTDKVTLAQAVAASSAFPPVLSPARLSFEETDFTPHSGAGGRNDLQHPPFTTQVQLTDGGVYDNLGLETIYKRYRTLLVSDAGSPFPALPDVPRNWAAQGRRAIDVVDHQVRALRVRLLLSAFAEGARKGAYWAINTDVASLPAANKLPCDYERIRELAELGTALGKLEPLLQQRLINLGYAVTDASVRSWFDPDVPAPTDFPYAGSGI